MAGEAYQKRYAGGFNDGDAATPDDAQFANAVETALRRLLGADPTDKAVQIWDAALGRFKTALLLNENVDAGAAIAKSKLAALNIVNADIAGGAAIAQSKLALAITNAQIDAAAAIAISKLAGYPSDVNKVLRGDGTWGSAAGASSQLDYAFRTTNVTISATTAATADLVIAGNSVAYDGTPIEITFYTPKMGSGAGSGFLVLYDEATQLGTLGEVQSSGDFRRVSTIITPTAANHQYTIKAYKSNVNITISAGDGAAGNLVPAYIRVTRAT